jgi:hypothetical protein
MEALRRCMHLAPPFNEEGTMNAIAAAAEQVLRAHPHPALRLVELVELLAERVDRSLDASKLRSALEGHPDRFRILDPWRGPWRAAGYEADGQPPDRDVWVVSVEDPGPPPIDPGPALKLRESVRWLARSVDPRSAGDVIRWHVIAISEREMRETLTKRAA